MSALIKIIQVETKLFFREPIAWIVSLALPCGLLAALGTVPALRTRDPAFDGLRFIDVFAPSLIVITLAMLGLNIMPIRLATYREKGVLRRMATTPMNPAYLLVAQLVVTTMLAVASVGLLVIIGRLLYGIPMPRRPLGFVLAFGLGMLSLVAVGLLIAAVARSSRVATAVSMPLFFAIMFFGGVYVPRPLLPEVLRRIGDYSPPGVQALLQTWIGSASAQAPQLITLAVITVLAGAAATRLFRWE